jgi:hypothetical protein
MAQGFCETYYNFAIELWIYGLTLFGNALLKFSNIYCEELISEDWAKLMGNVSFENVLPLIISLWESDSEFDWDFDAGNNDSEFSTEIMEVK